MTIENQEQNSVVEELKEREHWPTERQQEFLWLYKKVKELLQVAPNLRPTTVGTLLTLAAIATAEDSFGPRSETEAPEEFDRCVAGVERIYDHTDETDASHYVWCVAEDQGW